MLLTSLSNNLIPLLSSPDFHAAAPTVQEPQLKQKPPMSLTDEKFAVESDSFQGVLTTLNENGEMVENKVPTEKGD